MIGRLDGLAQAKGTIDFGIEPHAAQFFQPGGLGAAVRTVVGEIA